MPIRNSSALNFSPSGLTDSFGEQDSFPGSCWKLSNWVFDQSNPKKVIARPGVSVLTSFSGFSSPGVVSVIKQFGNRIYGMIATARNTNHDEPFSYDIDTNAFDTISGVTSGNTPTTQSTAGAWTPPTMDVIGTKLIVTHPGFNGVGSNFFGVIDISNQASPAWSSSNTATNALPSVPVAVAQFGERAYYAVGDAVYFSDVLVPLTITNANQILTMGNGFPINALSGLPLTTSQSGVLQGLMVFQKSSIFQITGDSATSNLALNQSSPNVGTPSPRTVITTPYGVMFLSTDSAYMVNLVGSVTLLQQSQSQDIHVPFINSYNATRAVAAYANGIYRVSLDTTIRNYVLTAADFWYDFHFQKWNGWHSFPYHCAIGYGNYFILASNSSPGKLYKSQPFPDSSTIYVDNNVAYLCSLETTTFNQDDPLAEKCVVESLIEVLQNSVSTSYSINAVDENENQYDSVVINTVINSSLWGTGIWGGFVWSSSIPSYSEFSIPWTKPITYKKLALQIFCPPSAGAGVGNISIREQHLGYRNTK